MFKSRNNIRPFIVIVRKIVTLLALPTSEFRQMLLLRTRLNVIT